MQVPDSELVSFEQRVDAAVQSWRQGDCTLGVQRFFSRADTENPLTAEARAMVGTIPVVDEVTVESEVDGLAVVTQTCDLVRSCTERAYVEVCPLVPVSSETLQETQRCQRPGYAYLPGLAAQHLVIDLDRVMTVEKSIVAKWTRVPGCATDDDVRRLSLALARKRARTAFPDDFGAAVKRLSDRIKKKHEKGSAEGEFLRALREIRVSATPSWDAQQVELLFYFVLAEPLSESVEPQWAALVREFLGMVKPSNRLLAPTSLLVTLDDMTARDYVDSDLLDLDHLSHRPSAATAKTAANGNDPPGE